jgi:DNA-binding SARP family transcriptional activator
MDVRIAMLGRLEVARHGENVTPPQPKLRQLLSLLAVDSETVVRSETITEELWNLPVSDKLTRTVQTYISQLRALLPVSTGCQFTHTPRVGYQLQLPSPSSLDVRQFLRLRDTAEKRTPQDAVEILLSALDLCHGEVLSDVSLGPVLSEHKTRLDAIRIGVLERYLELQLELGDAHAVLAQSDRVTKEDSRHESVYASLMLGMIALGRRAEATEIFYALRKRRAEQTGLEPGPAVQKVVNQLFDGEPAPALVRPSGVRAAPAQLPMDVPDFVGFTRELKLAESTLEHKPVLGIVGSPGSGKTAFCTHLGNRLSRRFPDGQLHADLDRVSAADALSGFIVALRPDGFVPANTHERMRLFRERTQELKVLVSLDNVRDVRDVATLRPGSAESAMLLCLPFRLPVDQGTTVVELPPMSREDLLELLAAKIGRTRVAREPQEARALVARCVGLPLAVSAIAAQLRVRPHWSLARLLHRLATSVHSSGFADLFASVERTLAALTDVERAQLAALTTARSEPDALSVHYAATTLAIAPLDAEQLLERLVEIRLADPVAAAAQSPESYRRYRVNPLYQLIARELLPEARPEGLLHSV